MYLVSGVVKGHDGEAAGLDLTRRSGDWPLALERTGGMDRRTRDAEGVAAAFLRSARPGNWKPRNPLPRLPPSDAENAGIASNTPEPSAPRREDA